MSQTLEDELAEFEASARKNFDGKRFARFQYDNELQFVALDKKEVESTDWIVICVGINYTQKPDRAEDSIMVTYHPSIRRARRNLKALMTRYETEENFNVLFTNLSPVITQKRWGDYSETERQAFLKLHEQDGKIKADHLQKIKELVEKNCCRDRIVWVFHTTATFWRAYPDCFDTVVRALGIKKAYLAQNLTYEAWDIDRVRLVQLP